MTVSTSDNRNGPYNGNGVTTSFSWGAYPVNDADTLKVYKTVAGVTTEVTTGITKNGVPGTSGTVVFGTAPASGEKITLIRESSGLQESDYSAEASIPPSQVESDLDNLAMFALEQAEKMGRAIKMPVTVDTATFSAEIPEPVAGKALIINSAGDGLDLGPDADQITAAQGYATAAETAKTGAETAEANAAASATAAAASAAAAAALDPATWHNVLTKAAGYAVVAPDDRGAEIRCTAALTLTLPAAATAGDGFFFFVRAEGGDVVVGADTIKDTWSARVFTDGTSWYVTRSMNETGPVDEIHALKATLADGDLIGRGASALQRIAKGSPGQVLRQDMTGNAQSYATLGWEVVDTFFSGLSSPSTIETSDMADGYDYLFEFKKMVPSAAAAFQMEVYGETDAAYHPTVLDIGASSASDLWGVVELFNARSDEVLKVAKSHPYRGTLSGDAGGVITGADLRTGIWRFSTGQKVLKARFGWTGAVTFTASLGTARMWRRAC